MVYEQDGNRWIFFHDLFGRWQWTLVDEAGCTLKQAKSGFGSYCSCVRDARAYGFRLTRARSTRLRSEPVSIVPIASTSAQSTDER